MLKIQNIKKIVLQALKEDCYRQDITSQLMIPADHRSHAVILVKENGILAGLPLVKETFRLTDPSLNYQSRFRDGMKVKKGTIIASISGKTRSLLTAERTALNFLSYLSGMATETKKYVDAIKPYKADILDTRKTTPTLRFLEKYAVRCGGGKNHRFNLQEMALIKDNHLAASRKLITFEQAIKQFRHKTNVPIEIEIDSLIQLDDALRASPDFILLDNMSIDQIKKAVQTVKKFKSKTKPLLEASGGVTLKNVRRIAQCGVDRISIGALTHHHCGLNVSMEITYEK